MKYSNLLLFIVLTQCLPNQAKASHLAGCDITYKCIDTLKFEVTLSWYRDCGGIPLTGTSAGTINVKCSNTSSRSISLPLESISSITPFCPSATNGCTPQNTMILNGAGVEKHVYKDTIDFNSTPLSALANCTGKIIISAFLNARNSSITTGPSGTMYNYAELDLQKAPCNSSPTFTSEAVGIMCCFQPFYMNLGASDTADNDSLSYSWAPPKNSFTQNVTYSTNFSYQHPFSVYYPGTTSPPTSYPLANPPIGLYLDPDVGDVTFTPTNCSEVTVAVIKVTEWRKDSSGIYQEIGETHRDMQFITKVCPDNNPPKINGPFSYQVCEGQELCFNITTKDVVFIPPPPAIPPAPDTVELFWNQAIPSASFTILDSTARLKTGRFCWTPPIGSWNSLPYTFTATVEDDACPIKARSIRAFRIRVKKTASTNRIINQLNDTTYSFLSAIDSSFVGLPSYANSILDSSGNPILDSTISRFKSTNSNQNFISKDTIIVKSNSPIILSSKINNQPFNCPKIQYDTLFPDSIFEVKIEQPKDSLLCAGTDYTLTTASQFAKGNIQYQWYKNGLLLTNDTLDHLVLRNIDTSLNDEYVLKVVDSIGNFNQDYVRVRSKRNFDNGFSNKYEACHGDSVTLTLDSAFINIKWKFIPGSLYSRTYHSSTFPIVNYSDTFGCSYTDSIDVIIHDLPSPMLSDSAVCDSIFELSSPNGPYMSYSWSTGDTSSSISISNSGLYIVEIVDSNGCKNSDTANVAILNPEKVNLGMDSSQCGDSILLTSNIVGSHQWSTSSTDSFIHVSQSGIYHVHSTDGLGCHSSDTIEINIFDLPNPDLGPDTSLCLNNVTLDPGTFTSYLWNNATVLNTLSVTSNGSYHVTVNDSNGCQNADTVTLTLFTPATVSLGNDTAFCGDSLLLMLAPGNSYTWSGGDTLNFTSINTSGDYWVQLKDSNDCTATDTVNITFLQNTIPPVLTRSGDSILSNKTGPHLWFKDGNEIVGEDTTFILQSGIGAYTAVHIDSNGCVSDTSNTLNRTLSVLQLDSKRVTVYPNPTTGKITVDLSHLTDVKKITLYDSYGRIVPVDLVVHKNRATLEWDAPSGVFWIRITTDKVVFQRPVIYVN